MDGVEFSCAGCFKQLRLCRSCWRNQLYCSSGCSGRSRLKSSRESQSRYARTIKGRKSQRRRDYTFRTKNITTEHSPKVEAPRVDDVLVVAAEVCARCGGEMVSGQIKKWALKERTERKSQMIAAKIKSAKFRQAQTVDNFDFKHNKAVEKIEKSYLALCSDISRDNLPPAVFSGTAGLGKTPLARALGYAACQKGLSVLFLTAAEMVNQLAHAQKVYRVDTIKSWGQSPP